MNTTYSYVSAPSSTVSASITALSDIANGPHLAARVADSVDGYEEVLTEIRRWVDADGGTKAPTATAEVRMIVAAWDSFIIVCCLVLLRLFVVLYTIVRREIIMREEL